MPRLLDSHLPVNDGLGCGTDGKRREDDVFDSAEKIYKKLASNAY